MISGLSSIVGRYGGYVEKFAGDALLALFGAPVSHEDDAARALLVALEMHRELARLCEDLPHEAELTLHCGVNSGHGIARILGSEARMDYAVLGDSVILAQRLESAAPKGETYVSDLTYRLTRRVRVRAGRRAHAQGQGEPVLAWRLVGERDDIERAEKRALVGRERELGHDRRRARRAQDGLGGVVAITGEPGVGKSRLAAGRRTIRGSWASLAGDAVPVIRSGDPYWPYADLVRRGGIRPRGPPPTVRGALAHRLADSAIG